jgi:hypothetical protein
MSEIPEGHTPIYIQDTKGEWQCIGYVSAEFAADCLSSGEGLWPATSLPDLTGKSVTVEMPVPEEDEPV